MRRRPPDGRGGSRARAAPVAPPRFHDSGAMRDGPVPALVRRRRGTCLPDRPAALADPRGPGGAERLEAGDPIDVDWGQAVALRGMLELFGVHVRRFAIGQARQLVRALGGEAGAPYVVVVC